MFEKALPALTVLVTVLVATTGVAAGATVTSANTTNEEIPNSADNESAGPDVGICVVGPDSPCNGENATHPSPLPEERIEDGNGSDDQQAGICLEGADSPCTDGSETDQHTGDTTDGQSADHPISAVSNLAAAILGISVTV